MPQDIDFFLPFDTGSNPDTDRAREHHIAWAHGRGLVRSTAALHRYRSWLLPELAAYAYPDVTGPDLDLVTDAVCLGFPLDDQFDGPLGRQPAQAARLTGELAAIAYREPGARPALDVPIVTAYADVWRRSAEGMSPAWRRRAADNWARFFRAYVAEARNRRHRVALDEDSYVRLRRRAVGTASCFDLIERAHHFELPPAVHGGAELRELNRCAGDVVFLCNDVHSVEREEARGDPHNIVLVRQRTTGCSRQRAVAWVRELVRERVERFLEVRAHAEGQCAARWGLDARRSDLTRYLDGLCAWMAGNQAWGVASARYAAGSAGPDFVEDVTRPLSPPERVGTGGGPG
ncbi:terpene synthase family protein [Streptomyces sp. TRM 70361]|uniref:terpene synthase family protein n=1 Tax=Streptomyces sp. TRM 70361 TaxID=3116553 RepID=UPI002E7BFE44|nr:terpene synthase family protein [Streptomyces sp. TRM 70361]MEE1939947.1 terpene synthase family protein [Streptomyces sp. TRM 70361]